MRLTTAGPVALYGSVLVDACVRFKTHYMDINLFGRDPVQVPFVYEFRYLRLS